MRNTTHAGDNRLAFLEIPLTVTSHQIAAGNRSHALAAAALWVASLPWALAAADADDEEARDVAVRVKALNLGFSVRSVAASKVPGLFEVATDGGMLYVTRDANYLITGNLYEVKDGGLVNLTEERQAVERRKLFADVDASDLITFTPEGGARSSVLVFTDADCGYCRQLHNEMPNYHANGIEVRYLAYPRAGVGSPTYDKMVSAWCSDDAQGALTALKRGEGIPERYCERHPVSEHFELGQIVGITGTPAIILADGRLLPGYVPPDDLAALLGL